MGRRFTRAYIKLSWLVTEEVKIEDEVVIGRLIASMRFHDSEETKW